MVRSVAQIIFRFLFVSALRSDIDLTTDDGLDAIFFRYVIELNGSEHIAVVGHGNGRHTKLNRAFYQCIMTNGRVLQTVGSMKMKMNKIGGAHRSI